MAAILLALIHSGCQVAQDPSSEHWAAIDAYKEASNAHFAESWQISQADMPTEEKERRQSELGPAPDIAPAVSAALAIIESNGERLMDAAEFILNSRGAPDESQRAAFDALVTHFGPDWDLLQAYIKAQTRFMQVSRAPTRDEGTAQIIQQGVEPPTLHASAAAHAIVETNHERAIEAAEFLMQQTYALRPGTSAVYLSASWLISGRERGEAALIELIGPDWKIIQAFIEESETWQAAEDSINGAHIDEEKKAKRLQALGEAPNAHRAAAAAVAIIDAEGSHEKTREAAEFLLEYPLRGGASRMLKGAQAIAAHFPDYDEWPMRLKQMDGACSAFAPAKSFITELSQRLTEPLGQATARYFAASYLIEEANQQHLDLDERTAKRAAAEQLAAGLSTGIEQETFVLMSQAEDGAEIPMTFADAEAELLYSLHSTMVGTVVSDVTARRLDGSQDSLSDYAGQVVLVDFWATWCGPCIQAFPKLRELADSLPKDRFQIIGVNVDGELETVTEFLARNPLDWTVWHVGDDSELARKWRITGFPTYILIGPEGRIIEKHAGSYDAEFRSKIMEAVRSVGA